MRWKIGIVLLLTVVVAVNAGFAWVAVRGADPVVPSYDVDR